MKVFLDTAEIDEIKKYSDVIDGVTTNPTLLRIAIEKRKGIKIKDYIAEICSVAGKGRPVSLEVASVDVEKMVREAQFLYENFNGIAGNVVVKVPVSTGSFGESIEGLRAIKEISKKGIPVNATLIMMPSQALLAAKAGASYVSPFAGRVDDYIRKNLGMKFSKEDYYDYEAVQDYKKESAKRSEKLEEFLKFYDAEGNSGIISGVDLVRKIKIAFENYGFEAKIIAASIRHVRQVFEVMEIGAHIATVPAYVLEEMIRHPKTDEGVKVFYEDSEKANYRELFES
ncbi:MAG: transaldolase family protein [Nitrososphaeria archaeon]